ncbi:MAG: serine/threonine protein kinase [Acidobacteria bacterium]|nr:serine/threonine protein kinase [Acidobacteriota bacterium]
MPVQKIGKYEIIRMIGKGSMGTVYEAHDPIIDRFVALKIISGKNIEHSEYLQRFKKEVQAQGRVLHPNVAVIFDVNYHAGDYIIVMEFVRGRSLRREMEQERIFTLRNFYRIVRQICSGLACAHRQGVIHRDIKPENIYLTDQDQVKILDFSIAKLQSSTTATDMNFLLGSAFYMSPEQIMGAAVGPETDQFSLGVLCFEMLSGQRPFAADNVADSILNTTRLQAPALFDLNPMVDPRLNEIIQRTLHKDPWQRYPSIAHFRKSLHLHFAELEPSLVEADLLEY